MTQITVGTTPVLLPVAGRQGVLLQNASTAQVYVDQDPNVAVGTGLKLAPGATQRLPPAGNNTHQYYVVADAPADVRFLITGGQITRIPDNA